MIVVSDTSPITNLIEIGRFDILRSLFRTVLIPPTVFQEATFHEHVRRELEDADWIQIVELTTNSLYTLLAERLDRGEAEAISLAVETSADLILIDEADGRREAQELGIVVTGLLGVLVRAKKQGLIPAVRPEINRLVLAADFWLGQDVINEALVLAGER